VTTETSQSSPDRHVRVVLAESDPSTRESLASHVAGLRGVELLAAEASAGDAIIATYRLRPDIVLLDLSPPDRPAPDAIRHLLRVCPGVSVAMLVDQEGDARLTPALDAGARESLPKSSPPDRLESILRRLGPNSFADGPQPPTT
jgi:DNA-binding NarL/FixJ family response regulator